MKEPLTSKRTLFVVKAHGPFTKMSVNFWSRRQAKNWKEYLKRHCGNEVKVWITEIV
jgi:hypothetical protein